MAEISGVEGSCLAGGVALEASDWSADLDQAVIDRSNYTTAGEPSNASGQRTGSISMNGPISTTTALAAKGVTRGTLVLFRLRVTVTLYIEVYGRVSKFNATGSHANGANWSVQASQYGAATIVGL